MKILFVSRSLAIGGAERQLVALASGLAQRGHDVVIASFYDDVPLATSLDPRAEVVVIGKRGRWDWSRFSRRLLDAIRAAQPDVIYSFLPVPNLVLAFLRRRLQRRPRLVWGVRSSDVDLSRYDWLTRLTYRIEGRVSRMADLVIVNSSAGLNHALRHGFTQSNVTVVPNGVDTTRFRPAPALRQQQRQEWGLSSDVPLVGIVARLDPLKDHDTFVAAAARVAAQRSDVSFVCVGSGEASERRRLTAKAVLLGVGERLHFFDATTRVEAVYNALDVVCSSSYSEGFPNVLAEAMSCGVPCVATDAGDSRVIVGDTGVIAPIRDAEGLAQGLLKMLHANADARTRARQRVVESFGIDAMVNRTEELFREVTR